MNTSRKTAIKESKVKITASSLIRLAGLSAIVAGLFYVAVGLFHPLNVLASVTTTRWIIVHYLATAMGFFGILGMVGLYARQAEKTGWLGLAGFVLFSLWFALMVGFCFVEAFILPRLATGLPAFVDGWMGMFNGTPSQINLGILPTLWTITTPLYLLGGLLFGIATFRARILSRWAAGLLAVGIVLGPIAALFPPELQPKVAVPVGLALAWLGYSLWSERREKVSEPLPGLGSPQPVQTGTD